MKNKKNIAILNTIDLITIGKPQQYENLEIFPLFSGVVPKTKYRTMKEGLKESDRYCGKRQFGLCAGTKSDQ